MSSYMNKLHLDILDMDEEIERREGMRISEIFEKKGEEYFRKLETQLLCEIENMKNLVVSCGGGVVLKSENVDLMKNQGVIVLLTASPETILERIKDDDSRPLLKGNKNVEFIQNMLNERIPKYQLAADIVVETDGKSLEDICKEILGNI